MDVTSLYTIIPNGEVLVTLKPFLEKRIIKELSTDTLLRLAELVFTPNCFSFNCEFFQQINGVAMGTKMGPSCANLFVGYVEEQFSKRVAVKRRTETAEKRKKQKCENSGKNGTKKRK